MIFYFSGCGNSKFVAETIAAGLNDSLIFIPEAAREDRYERRKAWLRVSYLFLGTAKIGA